MFASGHIQRILRHGLPALALYALLLQAFLIGATPARASAPVGVLCSEMAAGGEKAPAAPAGHDIECLCLAQCAKPHAPALAGGDAPAALPARIATLLHRALPTHRVGAPEKLVHTPGARAPPAA